MVIRANHIYTPCDGGLYYHHGIYVGNAKVTNPNNNEEEQEIDDAVIHFLAFDKKGKRTGSYQCNKCFNMPHHSGVIITCLDCFLGGNSLYVYKYGVSLPTFTFSSSGSCSTSSSYEPDEVIQTAFDFLNQKRNFGQYNLLFNNCEHFATYCKTGYRICNQVLCGTGLPGSIVYSIARGVLWGA